MRRIGACLFLVMLAHPGFAQTAQFPMKRWFVVETLNGTNVRDKALTFLADTVSPDATFEPTASGFAGCNTWRASYEIKAPDEFKLGGIATTKMMCAEGNVMQVEGDYVAALAKVVRWRVDGETLILTGEQTTLRLSPQTRP